MCNQLKALSLYTYRTTIKTNTMTRQELLNGKEYYYDNDAWCIENKSDRQKQADVSFSDHLNRFIIWFNGKIVADPKTFKSLENKLQKLKDKHSLKLVNNNSFEN